ncbi:MFS transporter, partial [Acinetobacter baumannii]
HRTQNYQVEIIKDLEQADPLVAQRLSTYQRSAAITTNDPALQTTQSMRSLNQVVTREAQVRAYNDVIALNGIFAVALLLWGGFNIARSKYLQRRGISRP